MTSPSAFAPPRALRLMSPTSARRLFGLDGDRVFSAPGENVAYEVEQGQLSARPLTAATPQRSAKGAVFWLPFWRVRFAAEVSGTGSGVQAVETAFRGKSAYVRGFSLVNALYVGDPGLSLTLEAFEPQLRVDAPPVCLGVRLSSAEAADIARLFLLEKADRVADVTGVRVTAEVERLELLMVPFDRHDRCLELLVGPATKFREETIIDLKGMEETFEVIRRSAS